MHGKIIPSAHRSDKASNKLVYVRCKNYKEVADVIRKLVVGGAPAIGVSAAFGLALGSQDSNAKRLPELITDLDNAFRCSRPTPTAVNLFWALERVMGKGKRAKTVQKQKEQCLTRRSRWRKRTSKPTGKSEHMASRLFKDGDIVLTHCNAGSLATVALVLPLVS